MSERIKVAVADELSAGQCKEVDAGGKSLALCNVGGKLHAVTNRCPHQRGPLGQGSLDGPVLMCPWHGWTFDVTTGENTVDSELTIETYEVDVVDGQVMVKVPE